VEPRGRGSVEGADEVAKYKVTYYARNERGGMEAYEAGAEAPTKADAERIVREGQSEAWGQRIRIAIAEEAAS